MATFVTRSTIFFLLIFYSNGVKCRSSQETLGKLDEILDEAKYLRRSRDSKDIPPIWKAYEFNTGAGNREELVVTNISIREYHNLPETEINWQFVEIEGSSYLIRSERSILSLYKLDIENNLITIAKTMEFSGVILTFKVSNFQTENWNAKSATVAVLCVESYSGTSLQWFRVLENDFQLFSTWPVQKHTKDLEFIQHENQNKLLLVDDDEMHNGKQYSTIDVYGFSIDFSNNNLKSWFWQRISVPRAFDIQVCSLYESASLALQGVDNVLLYQYRDTIAGSIFQEVQTINAHNLRNFVCFESGHIQYLAVSGPQAALFNFFENEFQHNRETESNFDIADITWIKDIRMNTYRDESLLLIQLKNSTVIALAWQGVGFKRIPLPSEILDQVDLSKVTAIPKFGFIWKNQFVKIETTLKNLKHPVQSEIEQMQGRQALLEVVLNSQESIIDKTDKLLEESYFVNPNVTGFWNLSNVKTINATLEDGVNYQSFSIGSTNLTIEDLQSDVNYSMNALNNLQDKLEEINLRLKAAIDSNATDISLDTDIDITGNINITGTLTVKNLTVHYINDVEISSDLNETHNDFLVDGGKSIPPMETANFTINSVNGVPISNILFGESTKDYSDVDFSKINRAIIDGHFSFSVLNGVDWEALMQNVVWKDKMTIIPGTTVIEGTLIAEDFQVDNLNGLRYPHDYVLTESNIFANVTGSKTFEKLSVNKLLDVKTINDVDINDYVIINKENVLENEITFENLTVEGPLQVDKKIAGTEADEMLTLNETTDISTDIIFVNLKVLGNVTVEDSIAGQNWSKFEDLLQKTDEIVEITGTKTFLADVEITSNITITSDLINGHRLDEFVTLDGEQELPYLEKISANVSFGNVTYGAVEKLEKFLKENINATTNCLERIISFKSAVVVDDLSIVTLRGTVPGELFTRKLNETFQTVYFDDLTVSTLLADEILPNAVNGINFTDLVESLATPTIIDNYAIGNLTTDRLQAKTINGMSLDELNSLKDLMETSYRQIFQGNVSLESLRVTGIINATSINNIVLEDLYREETMGTVIFEKDVSIENLQVLGLVNEHNFTEYVADAVLKTDTNIVLTGHKTFDSIYCHELEVKSLNGHPVENLLNPNVEQVLTGPVIVNGSVTVLESFDTNGKIGNVSFHDLMDRFKFLGSNTYELHGDFSFPDDVHIKNLYTDGPVQGVSFDDFFENVVFKDHDNVTITGAKVFENQVTFNDAVVVRDRWNDLDLKRFYEKAVFIDKPFSINSKVIFEDEIIIAKDLIVRTNFETKTMMGVDMAELEASVLYKNRPTYVSAPMTFTNATFESDVEIEMINDLNMSLLIPLHTDQIIPVETFQCSNVTVENLEILGKINGQDLKAIKEDTFMLYGDQTITGHINFQGNVYARHNFDAHLINGINPNQIVLANSNETLSGNFVFEKPIVFERSLRVLGPLSGINLNRWQAVAVTTSFPLTQIVSGQWTVHGNVYFEKGATGTDILNGVNVTELSDALAEINLEMDVVVDEGKLNLQTMCEDLKMLKTYAERQIYKFNVFDYLQILEFDRNIVSVHYFELDDLDYLLISYDTCQMNAFLFTGEKFELVAKVADFGAVDRWTTFKFGKILYILTIGKNSCGRSPGNLWKLENDEFIHILDLGNVTDSKKLNEDAFLTLIDKRVEKWSTREASKQEKSVSSHADEEDLKFILNSDRVLLTSRQSIYEYDAEKLNSTNSKNHFGSSEIFSFKVGIYEKEWFLYYDEKVSKNYIFICNNDVTQMEILQTIKARRPTSFTVVNFDGLIETLLIFVENGRNIQIYEYQGIQGFVHRDTIQMSVDKLFTFKIRKYSNLVKRQCLGLVRENRLTILEAKMFGDKLDMEPLTCTEN